MFEANTSYWARRAAEHAELAQVAAHRAAVAAHRALAQAYSRRADEMKRAG